MQVDQIVTNRNNFTTLSICFSRAPLTQTCLFYRMVAVSLSIKSFLCSLQADQRPISLEGRLTQSALEERGLLQAFHAWKREQYKLLHALRRDDAQRERDRVNQATSRAMRNGRAQTREEALALVNPRWTTGAGPVPRKPRWYASKSPSAELRQQILQKLERTSFGRANHRTRAVREGTGLVFGTVYSPRLKRYTESSQANSNPVLYKMLKQLAAAEVPDFSYTTIQVNKNVVTNPHRDKFNVGPTVILGLGNFRGADLVVCEQQYKLSCHRWLYFWGKDEHYNTPLTYGTKYTITLFTLLPPYAEPTANTHALLGRSS